MGQSHPPGAQPHHPERPVAEKVSALADQVMNHLPAGTGDRAEEGFPEPAQGMAGVVGAKQLRRFQHDDADADDDREPGAQPELEALAGGSASAFPGSGNRH